MGKQQPVRTAQHSPNGEIGIHRMVKLRYRVLAAVLLLPATFWADNGAPIDVTENTAPPPSLAFARYLAALERNHPWTEVAVDVDAVLPKLAEHGRLKAIRRLLPFGKPQYQVLEIEGDRTVRQQVIARYLTADARAAAMPSSSVAVTPQNYKFRYVGSIGQGDALAYVFRIAPRKKRAGLIKGELWIDAQSGEAVHQAGRLVKSGSIFLRRIDITRDTEIHEGRPYMRVTHLDVDTRLAGRAELTVKERPCGPGSESADQVLQEACLVTFGNSSE
jgi:hypothetical protein